MRLTTYPWINESRAGAQCSARTTSVTGTPARDKGWELPATVKCSAIVSIRCRLCALVWSVCDGFFPVAPVRVRFLQQVYKDIGFLIIIKQN